MNLPTDHAAHVAAAIPSRTTRRTRRPSGEPPPLPRHLQTSGVGWLVAAAILSTRLPEPDAATLPK